MASAMTLAWARNGQNVPTQAIPMGGQRFINVGAATSVGNYMRVREFIENIPIFMQDQESSADRISVSAQYFTSVSANQAPGDGTRVLIRVASNKSSAVLYLNGHSANVEYGDGTPAPTMANGGIYEFIYSSVDAAWKAQNPDNDKRITAAELAAGLTTADIDRRYPLGHMFRYRIPTDGTSDCTPALNKAIAVAAQVSGGISFFFPSIGTAYRFTTKPDDIEKSLHIYGDSTNTTLWRDYNGSTPADGLFNIRGGASSFLIENFTILSVSGRTGGSLISVVCGSTDAEETNNGMLRNLRLSTTGTDTHDYAVYIDGSAKSTGSATGVRLMTMDSCHIFGGALGSVFEKSTMSFRMIGCNTFEAGGTSGNLVVRGTASVVASYTLFTGGFCSGIDAEDSEQLVVYCNRIAGDVTLSSACKDPLILGHCTGTVTDNATYTNRSVATLLNTRAILADQVLIGNITSSTLALEAVGAITGRTSGSVTNIGHAGATGDTVCPDGDTFTFNSALSKLFVIANNSTGASALVFCSFPSATINIVYDDSNVFEASSTPSAGQTGIFKSAGSHTVSIKNNSGGSITYSIVNLGNVSSVTDPA